MKKHAVTLVHQAAMPIAVHAIRSFNQHFSESYRLDIHTDGSPNSKDEATLLEAASGMDVHIIRPSDRQKVLEIRLAYFPKIRALLDGVGYNAKLELPMVIETPYFYFDSDIVWLRPVANLEPQNAPNAFSTESWSWYNGIANSKLWIKAKTPRRVNSGFYYLSEPFPFGRMEDMLEKGMFDSTARYNTDQEIMAYLYPSMEMYHSEDLKRSRRDSRYHLTSEPSAALHFPGGMWRDHLDQMDALRDLTRDPVTIRYQKPVPLNHWELLRMRMTVKICDAPLLRRVINISRNLIR